MLAIVTIAGNQYKVTEGQEIFVHRLEAEEGAELSFNQVHLLENSGSVTVGTPIVKGANVGATVLQPLVKGDKVIVFKKKRRKGYRVKNGHRQQFSKIKIDKITG
jgi:large subunit ribosomal protein L21